MWEQRYGFPEPSRTQSGYRRYGSEDVRTLRRVRGFRARGLSVPAAIERARESASGQRPSIYAAVAEEHPSAPQVLRKRTLVALSRAIEHEAMARATGAVLFGAFQHEPNYRAVERRYRRMARYAETAVVFADFDHLAAPEGGPVEVPIATEDKVGNEWAVVVDSADFCAALLAWEVPGLNRPGSADDGDRRFEAIWTVDPVAVRRASESAARLAGRADEELGVRLEALLADQPINGDGPSPVLTTLTNRMVSYMESATG